MIKYPYQIVLAAKVFYGYWLVEIKNYVLLILNIFTLSFYFFL